MLHKLALGALPGDSRDAAVSAAAYLAADALRRGLFGTWQAPQPMRVKVGLPFIACSARCGSLRFRPDREMRPSVRPRAAVSRTSPRGFP